MTAIQALKAKCALSNKDIMRTFRVPMDTAREWANVETPGDIASICDEVCRIVDRVQSEDVRDNRAQLLMKAGDELRAELASLRKDCAAQQVRIARYERGGVLGAIGHFWIDPVIRVITKLCRSIGHE
jgi:hypothetical protein